MESEILEKLKRKGGYNDGRIRPYPFDPALWIAETYIPGRTARKTWKVLREERRDAYRLFASAEQAALSLETWIHRFDDEAPFRQEKGDRP
jgi:hypothetical protein